MCSHPSIRDFPDEIRDIAERFVDLQDVRLSADYDPYGTLFKSDVEDFIASARVALRIDALRAEVDASATH